MREFLLDLLVQYGRGRIPPQYMIDGILGPRSGKTYHPQLTAAIAGGYIGHIYPAKGYYLTDKALEYLNEGSAATVVDTARD